MGGGVGQGSFSLRRRKLKLDYSCSQLPGRISDQGLANSKMDAFRWRLKSL